MTTNDIKMATHADIIRHAKDYLRTPGLAEKFADFITPHLGQPNDADGTGYTASGDTRDRHYVRVWEAYHTQDTARLAEMVWDYDYASLLPVILLWGHQHARTGGPALVEDAPSAKGPAPNEVRTHTRTLKSGKVITVRPYSRGKVAA